MRRPEDSELLDALAADLAHLLRELAELAKLIDEAIECDAPRRGLHFLGHETGHCS